ncbi:MAG: hypothetical protein B5M56_08780 [Desulfococcus sp. 4484_241]|nr:MAG: hypothetical protein B5M56_08780 [Desulfococcus sp. 4484_241]
MGSALLITIGVLFAIGGIVGCLLPILPGPVLSYLSLVFLDMAKGWSAFGATFLVVMGLLALLMIVLDYIAAMIGAKKFGSSKAGIIGSGLGMIAGLVLFPPAGIFIGAILGAIAGEMLVGQKTSAAVRAGWGVLLGSLAGTAIKLAYCVTVLLFVIKGLF